MNKREILIEAVNDVSNIMEKVKETNSWESLTDDDIIKVGLIFASMASAMNQLYNERHLLDEDDWNTFGTLLDNKAIEMGFCDDIFQETFRLYDKG